MDLLFYPDERLKKICEPVLIFTRDIQETVRQMVETMYAHEGVGLAANQVGIFRRIMIVDPRCWDEQKADPLVFVNPRILWQQGTQRKSEGCLSFPGTHEYVARYDEIKVQAEDERGDTWIWEGNGLISRVIQHELDHLDGKLLIDRVPRVCVQIIKRKQLARVRREKRKQAKREILMEVAKENKSVLELPSSPTVKSRDDGPLIKL